jgi:hypothetical protein
MKLKPLPPPQVLTYYLPTGSKEQVGFFWPQTFYQQQRFVLLYIVVIFLIWFSSASIFSFPGAFLNSCLCCGMSAGYIWCCFALECLIGEDQGWALCRLPLPKSTVGKLQSLSSHSGEIL